MTLVKLACGCLDLHIIHGLHEAGRGHEECRVADAARGGDDLAAAAVQRLCGGANQGGVEGERAGSREAHGTWCRGLLAWLGSINAVEHCKAIENRILGNGRAQDLGYFSHTHCEHMSRANNLTCVAASPLAMAASSLGNCAWAAYWQV